MHVGPRRSGTAAFSVAFPKRHNLARDRCQCTLPGVCNLYRNFSNLEEIRRLFRVSRVHPERR